MSDKVVSLERVQFLSSLNNLLFPKSPIDKEVKQVLDDLSSYIDRIDIFEDMFKAGLTGQVHLRDTQSLTNLAFMRGLDQLWLRFSAKDKQNLTGKPRNYAPGGFTVYNQTLRSPVNQGTEIYTLGICSPEIINSVSRKISRYYFDKPEIGRSFLFLSNRDGFRKPFQTTKVKKIIDEFTFETINSVYYLIDKERERDIKIEDILK